MMTAMRAQFEHQREQILANLTNAPTGKGYYKRKDWLNDLLDWAAANDGFANAIKPIIFSALVETGRDAMSEVGKQPDFYDPFTPALRDYFTNRPTKIAADVNEETEKQLRATLSRGVQAGESSGELRARVEAVMGSASTMRADRIARTEVARAQGYADIQAWTQSGVVSGKEWYTAKDERVCPFCNSLDGQVFNLPDNIFDKGDTLTIGDQTQQYNYDDVPSPPLHVQCRCTLLPVLI